MPNSTTTYEVIVPATKFFAKPAITSSIETEILFGESVEVLEENGQFCLARSNRYATQGYILTTHLKRRELQPRSVTSTYRVAVPRANIYTEANFKCPDPQDRFLTMNAIVWVTDYSRTPEGEMACVDGLGWIFNSQLRHIDDFYTDYVDVALMYVGGPATYTWGSLTFPDCSGLLQQALWACNIPCPRNVSEQMNRIGVEVSYEDVGFRYQRGDFVFMVDPQRSIRHVVIMVDHEKCVHATIASPFRGTVVQPLSKVIEHQFSGTRYDPTTVRRFPLR